MRQAPDHDNGALGIDHVVITTPNFARTSGALTDAGLELRRFREAPGGFRQGFRRLGQAILELVEIRDAPDPAAPPGSGVGRDRARSRCVDRAPGRAAGPGQGRRSAGSQDRHTPGRRWSRSRGGVHDAGAVKRPRYARQTVSLERFSPHTREWFTQAFEAPTPAQEQGWPAISSGEHVLISAPTGSGKTLAAFLWAIDRLVAERREAATGGDADTDSAERGISLVYVSPLKALSYDIDRNLRVPLRGLGDRSDRGCPDR